MVKAKEFLERTAKFWTENGVEDRVQRRVEVSQPEEKGQHNITEVARIADGKQDGNDEERQPANHKRTRDNRLRPINHQSFNHHQSLATPIISHNCINHQ